MKFLQVQASQVAHLDILELVPTSLIQRVQVGGIGWQPFDPDPASPAALEELVDFRPPVDWRWLSGSEIWLGADGPK